MSYSLTKWHHGQMNQHTASTVTGHMAWPCVYTLSPDSLSHFFPLNHWSRWWSEQEEMTIILHEQLLNRCPEPSLHLCVHYKTTVSGGMQSWLQLLDDKVQHSRGWVVNLGFFFVELTVFDWQGNAQSTWRQGCVYELCACNGERGLTELLY